MTFVEIDEAAAGFCSQNIAENALDSRAIVLHADVAVAASAHRGEADLVVCNPPYVAPGAGRAPPEARRAKARQGDLAAFITAARLLLGRRGRACFVYPAHNLTGLLSLVRASGLEPKRLRAVHAKATSPARIVLVEAQAAKAGGLLIEPPLVEIA